MRSVSRSFRIGRRARWLLLELLIVFLGVSAAFGLDRYRDQVENARRERMIYAALLEQTLDIQDEIAGARLHFDSVYVTPFAEGYARGEMPRLHPIRLGGGGMGAMWAAMLQAGGLDVLDPAFIFEVEEYMSWVRYDASVRERFTRLSDQYLLPNLGRHPEHFYDVSTRALRPEFAWYPQNLVAVQRSTAAVDSLTIQLRTMLEERLEARR